MQHDGHSTQLRQLYLATLNWIRLELREEKRTELPKLLKAWEAMPSFFSSCKRAIKATQHILQNLGLHILKVRQSLFCLGEVPLLPIVIRVRCIRWNDVLRNDRAGINLALPRLYPIFSFTQRVIINTATHLQPRNHAGFLLKRWVDTVRIIHCQHTSIVHTFRRSCHAP